MKIKIVQESTRTPDEVEIRLRPGSDRPDKHVLLERRNPRTGKWVVLASFDSTVQSEPSFIVRPNNWPYETRVDGYKPEVTK